MAFTVTARHAGTHGGASAQTKATDSVTPTADSLLLVGSGGQGDNDFTNNPVIQTPTGGGLSYTLCAKAGESPQYPFGATLTQYDTSGAVFRAPIGASPSAFAVTVDHYSSTTPAFYSVRAIDITGHSVASPIVQSAANGGSVGAGGSGSDTGTGSVTLGAAPTSGNLLVVWLFKAADGAAAAASPTAGAGKTMTQVVNEATTLMATGIWHRTCDGTESATIDCSDLGTQVGAYVMVAVEVASDGTPPPPDPLAYVNQGTVGVGSTTVTPGAPASLVNGNLVEITVITKPDTATINVPADWTLQADVAGGGGSNGNGTGPTRMAKLTRIKDAGWSAMPAISITNGNSSSAIAMQFSKDADLAWSLAAATGAYGTAAATTNGAATLGSDPGITVGDLLSVGYSNQDEAPTWSAQGVTATGVSNVGTVTERSEAVETTTGLDQGGMVFTAGPVVAGTSSAAPATQATLSAAGRGVVILLRLRQIANATDLVVADATHAQAADTVALVQDHTLAVQAATHAQTVENLALTQVHELAVNDASHAQSSEVPTLQVVLGAQDATHGHTAENITLTQVHELVVQDAAHGHTAEAVALTQVHQLVVQDAAHAHSSEAPGLAQTHILAVDNANHAQTVETPTLTQVHVLAVQDANHAQTAESPALTQVHQLVVQDTAHAVTSDTPALVQQHTLAVDPAVHAHSSENIGLSGAGTLSVQDATHGHTAETVALTQVHVLAPQDAFHELSSSSPTLVVGAINLTVQDAEHAHTADTPALTQVHVLVVQAAVHEQTADTVALEVTLAVADAFHAIASTTVALTQVHVLVVDDALHAHVADDVVLAQTHILVVDDATHAQTVENVTLFFVAPGDGAWVPRPRLSHLTRVGASGLNGRGRATLDQTPHATLDGATP